MMKKLLSLVMLSLLCMSTTVQAAETTVNFRDLYGEATVQPATPVSYNGLNFSFAKGSAGTEPAWFVNADYDYFEIRLYGGSSASNPDGNTMTITSASTMTKIVLNHGSSCTWAELKADVGTITVDASTHDATWTGNATSVTITTLRGSKATQYRFKSAVVTTDGQGEETVATPTFSVAAGTYYSPFNVEIKCGTADATIHYTTDGTEPTAASTAYSSAIAIAISQNTTLKAIAIKGDKQSQVATAEYVMGTATAVANLAAFRAMTDGEMVTFTNPVTALAQKGSYLYVMDDSGYGLIYGSVGKTYANGMTIPAGFIGMKKTYDGEPELAKPLSGFSDGVAGAEVAPEEIQCEDVSADLWGHYVLIKGATISPYYKTLTDASGTVGIHTTLGGYSASTDTTKTYDVYGIIGSYGAENTIYQVLPVKLVDPNAGVDNIAAYAALANNTVETIKGDVTVYYANGQNLYVMDESGYLCIFGTTGQTYKNGDVIPGGFGGTKVIYNGGPEMKAPLTGFTAPKANNPVAPQLKTTTDVVAGAWGQYMILKDVTISGVSGKNMTLTDANGSVAGYNSFEVGLPGDLTKTYDVEGIVATYKDAPQLLITKVGGDIVIPEVADIDALLQLNSGTVGKIKSDLVAIYQNGRDLYVKNGDTYMLAYGTLTEKFENGDIIRDAMASWTTFNGNKQLTPVDSTFTVAAKGAAVEPVEMPIEEIGQDMIHTYFIIKNASLTAEAISDDTGEAVLYNRFKIDLPTAEEMQANKYDVKCFLTVYNQQLEFYPVEWAKAGGQEYAKGDVNGDGTVDIADINILINIMLNKDSADRYDGRANVDGQGAVDIADINAVINAMLGK